MHTSQSKCSTRYIDHPSLQPSVRFHESSAAGTSVMSVPPLLSAYTAVVAQGEGARVS